MIQVSSTAKSRYLSRKTKLSDAFVALEPK
jgi:hypothetical protein